MVSRRIGSIACTGCGRTLAVTDLSTTIRCEGCGGSEAVPLEVREDIDIGVRLAEDYEQEAQRELSQVLSAVLSPKSPTRTWVAFGVLAAGVVGAGRSMGGASPATVALSALGAMAVTMLVMGWTAEWLTVGRLATSMKTLSPSMGSFTTSCPGCRQAMQLPEGSSEIPCVSCGQPIAHAHGMAVLRDPPESRPTRWWAAAEELAEQHASALPGRSSGFQLFTGAVVLALLAAWSWS